MVRFTSAQQFLDPVFFGDQWSRNEGTKPSGRCCIRTCSPQTGLEMEANNEKFCRFATTINNFIASYRISSTDTDKPNFYLAICQLSQLFAILDQTNEDEELFQGKLKPSLTELRFNLEAHDASFKDFIVNHWYEIKQEQGGENTLTFKDANGRRITTISYKDTNYLVKKCFTIIFDLLKRHLESNCEKSNCHVCVNKDLITSTIEDNPFEEEVLIVPNQETGCSQNAGMPPSTELNTTSGDCLDYESQTVENDDEFTSASIPVGGMAKNTASAVIKGGQVDTSCCTDDSENVMTVAARDMDFIFEIDNRKHGITNTTQDSHTTIHGYTNVSINTNQIAAHTDSDTQSKFLETGDSTSNYKPRSICAETKNSTETTRSPNSLDEVDVKESKLEPGWSYRHPYDTPDSESEDTPDSESEDTSDSESEDTSDSESECYNSQVDNSQVTKAKFEQESFHKLINKDYNELEKFIAKSNIEQQNVVLAYKEDRKHCKHEHCKYENCNCEHCESKLCMSRHCKNTHCEYKRCKCKHCKYEHCKYKHCKSVKDAMTIAYQLREKMRPNYAVINIKDNRDYSKKKTEKKYVKQNNHSKVYPSVCGSLNVPNYAAVQRTFNVDTGAYWPSVTWDPQSPYFKNAIFSIKTINDEATPMMIASICIEGMDLTGLTFCDVDTSEWSAVGMLHLNKYHAVISGCKIDLYPIKDYELVKGELNMYIEHIHPKQL